MAASSAAITAIGVSASRWATSVPTVLATCVLMNAPRKFKQAAMMMAKRAGSTRVEMLVATAFAVSWKPLVKSNISAIRIVAIRNARLAPPPEPAAAMVRVEAKCGSGIFQQHPIEHVGHVLTVVNRPLQVIVDLLPLDHLHGIGLAEERLQRLAIHRVAVVLQTVDLSQTCAERVAILARLQQDKRLLHLGGGARDQPRHLDGGGRRSLDAVDHEVIRGCLDQVQHVVECGGNGSDVLTIERCHEEAVEQVIHLMGQLVAAMLYVLD